MSREIPLDILLKNSVGLVDNEDENKEDKSVLQKKALKNFTENVKFNPIEGSDKARIQIALTRLPDYLYPLRVDGKKITDQAVGRFLNMEKRLAHPRNKKLKEGVHDRIKDLIKDEMLELVGDWKSYKPEFNKDQEPGKENILLPWQTLIDSNKTSEHSKIRMCLDGTESNKLLYKIEADMPGLQDILISWKTAKEWCTVDIVKMFWTIETSPNDAKLQHCLWRDSKEEELLLYLFKRVVMGLSDSPGIARLVLIELANRFKDKLPQAKEVIEKFTYMDDANIFGNNTDNVVEKAL